MDLLSHVEHARPYGRRATRALAFAALAFAVACTDAPAESDAGSVTLGSDDGASTVSSTTEIGASGSSGTTTADSTGPPPPIEPTVVMTFNVLCALCSQGYEPWDARVPYMADTIARHAPQLIGLQEVLTADEVEQLRAAVDLSYEAIYYAGEEHAYADALIFYDPTRFEPIEQGFYWLSPTPDAPFSTGFSDGFQLARLAAWVRLVERPSGRELLFVDTHFDNNSPSQELSAPLVLERTEALGGGLVPTIVVGDFNARPADLAYEILTEGDDGGGFRLEDVFDLAESWSVDTNEPTAPSYDPEGRIDHLFVSGAAWQSAWWTVDTHTYGPDALYVSDHFAIAAELAADG